jgi:hypothetical protein
MRRQRNLKALLTLLDLVQMSARVSGTPMQMVRKLTKMRPNSMLTMAGEQVS